MADIVGRIDCELLAEFVDVALPGVGANAPVMDQQQRRFVAVTFIEVARVDAVDIDKLAMSLSLLKFVGQASLVDDAMLPS